MQLAKRVKSAVRRGMADPTVLIAVILALALTYLVIAPLISMAIGTVQVGVRDSAVSGLPTGSLTPSFYTRVLTSPVSKILFWKPLWRTLFVALMVSLIAIPLGGAAAYLLKKSDLPGKGWISKFMMLPYIMPSWTFATVWITLFKNRRLGGTPGFFESLGLVPPNWLAYGALPIILCESFHLFPFAFTLFANALGSDGCPARGVSQGGWGPRRRRDAAHRPSPSPALPPLGLSPHLHAGPGLLRDALHPRIAGEIQPPAHGALQRL